MVRIRTLKRATSPQVASPDSPTTLAGFSLGGNIALKLLRQLIERGVVPSVVKDHKMTNQDAEVIVVLGALLQTLPVLPVEAIAAALNAHLPERHRRHLPANLQALRQGAAFARGELDLSAVGITNNGHKAQRTN